MPLNPALPDVHLLPEYVRLLVEHTPGAIAMFDRDLRYLMTSRRWLEDYRLGDRDIIGQCHYDIFPGTSNWWKAIHQRCLQGQVERCDDEAFARADGSTAWLKWEGRPWHNDLGEVGGVLMFTEVITARQQIELALENANRALQEANQSLKAQAAHHKAELNNFFDLSADMLCIADFNGYFKRVNPSFERVLGYTAAELMAEPFLGFVHPDDQAATVEESSKTAAGEKVIAFENRYRCKDGGYRWFSWTAASDLDAQVIYGTVRDITERKAAEADIQQKQAQIQGQEQYLRSIFEGGHYVFVLDVDSTVEADAIQRFHFSGWNSTLEKFWNMPREAVLGKSLVEVLPEDGESIFQRCCECVAAGQAITYKARVGGEWWLTTLTPLIDESGQVYRIVGAPVRITEQKQTEEELQQSQIQIRQQEEFLRSVFDGSEHSVFVLDTEDGENFIFTGWNRAACLSIGVSHNAVIGHSPEAVFTPEDAAAVLQRYRTCARSQQTYAYEEFIADQWWYTLLNPLMTEQGQVYRIVGTASNITVRKQAELETERQARQESLLYRITQNIRDSLDFGQILNIATQSIRDYLGVDRCHFAWYVEGGDGEAHWDVSSEAKSPEIHSLVGRHRAANFAGLSDLILRREMIRIDEACAHSDSGVREALQWLGHRALLLFPVCGQSGSLGAVACAHDRQVHTWTDDEVEFIEAVVNQLAIALNQAELYRESVLKARELQTAMAELQRTQTQMVQAEKMSSLGQLVAGVAHEINNPVNFIFGNLTHAREYTQDLLHLVELYQIHYPDPHKAIREEADAIDLDFLMGDLPKLLNSMKLGATRIQGIVASLRTFSRMDEAEMKAVNIHDGIDSTLVILQSRIKAKPNRPEINIITQYGNLPMVECYAGQLNQVFMNLIGNAIDALEDTWSQGKEQGSDLRIQITTRLTADRQVQIAIADNGSGIPDGVKARIFDPFYTTKAIGKGTGMGLSISYQIVVDKHQGHLECTSTPGEGTEFVITIPLAQTELHLAEVN
ncbi:MAG: PAS domain S-box protein [Cyanobacteria bacterium P01_D01_bin.128]